MMSDVLNVFALSSFILGGISILLAVNYTFLSLNKKFEEETAQLLRLTRISAILSLLAPLFYCVLSDPWLLYEAIENTSGMYAVFASAWLVILVLGVLIFLFELTMKKNTAEKPQRKGLYGFAVFMVTVASLLSWLFS